MIFKTERLAIRKFILNDLDDFYDMLGNYEVMKHIKAPLNYEESRNELKRFISYYDEELKEYHIWAAELKENKILIGLCGYYLNDKMEYEIAYRLRQSYWNKGYGLELTRALLNYLSRFSHIKNIVAYVTKEKMIVLRVMINHRSTNIF